MGHGVQMWFIVKAGKDGFIILDESDVYMHADLQRRLKAQQLCFVLWQPYCRLYRLLVKKNVAHCWTADTLKSEKQDLKRITGTKQSEEKLSVVFTVLDIKEPPIVAILQLGGSLSVVGVLQLIM